MSPGVDDGRYGRAYQGLTVPWFRRTQVRHAGHIQACGSADNGVDKDVSSVEENGLVINDQIDDAYLTKYSGSLKSMLMARRKAKPVSPNR